MQILTSKISGRELFPTYTHAFTHGKWVREQVLTTFLTASGKLILSWTIPATSPRVQPHKQLHWHKNGEAQPESENKWRWGWFGEPINDLHHSKEDHSVTPLVIATAQTCHLQSDSSKVSVFCACCFPRLQHPSTPWLSQGSDTEKTKSGVGGAAGERLR